MKLRKILSVIMSAAVILSATALSPVTASNNADASLPALNNYLLEKDQNYIRGDYTNDSVTDIFDLTHLRQPQKQPPVTGGTPVAQHGKLSVKGPDLVDKNGQKFQLYGASTHGIAWYPQYINFDSFKTQRENWNTNVIRIAMYTAEKDGYCSGGNRDYLKGLVKNGVDYATQLGMYVIIDWHVLNDNPGDKSMNGNPNTFKEDAKAFFREMSQLYKNNENVLYEICNEPNGGGVSWDTVKQYANEVIPVIRENDPKAVILVGTPTWSQDIHMAQQSPLNFDNIMYVLHFYAATHKDALRSRLESCVSGGLPVFVSEFAMCDASGNGGNDFGSGQQWMDLIKRYNLSFCSWNLGNKAESSCIFTAGNGNTSNWNDGDYTEWGKWIVNYFKNNK